MLPGAGSGGLIGPVLPFGGGLSGSPDDGPLSGIGGQMSAGREPPRSLPPRISYTDATPLILSDTDESRARIRQSLEGFYAGGLSPIDLAQLAAEQLARLAAWAEFERAAAWGQRPGLAAGGVRQAGLGGWIGDDADRLEAGVLADPGLV
jgi:hypothetical protein